LKNSDVVYEISKGKVYKQHNQIEGTDTKTPNKYQWSQLFRLEFCRRHQNSKNKPACSQLFGFFYRFLCYAGAANFRFIKFKTLNWTIPSLSDLEFAEQN
jgi:hypothetical protein